MNIKYLDKLRNLEKDLNSMKNPTFKKLKQLFYNTKYSFLRETIIEKMIKIDTVQSTKLIKSEIRKNNANKYYLETLYIYLCKIDDPEGFAFVKKLFQKKNNYSLAELLFNKGVSISNRFLLNKSLTSNVFIAYRLASALNVKNPIYKTILHNIQKNFTRLKLPPYNTYITNNELKQLKNPNLKIDDLKYYKNLIKKILIKRKNIKSPRGVRATLRKTHGRKKRAWLQRRTRRSRQDNINALS